MAVAAAVATGNGTTPSLSASVYFSYSAEWPTTYACGRTDMLPWGEIHRP